jgi:hypothetical protein
MAAREDLGPTSNEIPPLERLTDIQPAQGVYHHESLTSNPGGNWQHFTRRDAVMARPYSEREQFMTENMTGFVWLLRRK